MGSSSGVGIAAAAFYLPRCVITADEYRRSLGTFHATGIEEKRVPAYDEDEVTMAVEAGQRAIDAAERPVAFLAYGTSSHASALDVLASALNLEDADREEILGEPDGGVAALRLALDRTAANGRASLVIASDAPGAFQGSPAEHPLAAAAAAFVITADGKVPRTDRAGIPPGRDLVASVGFTGAASDPLALVDAIGRAEPGTRIASDSLVFDVVDRPAGDLDVRRALDLRTPIPYEQYLRFRRYGAVPPGTEFSQGAYVSPTAYLAEAKARYRLVGEECAKCGRLHFPPRESCLACGAREWKARPLKRTGTVYAYTIIGKGAAPSEFLAQQLATGDYATAVVELDDGLRVTSMLADVDPASVKIGMRVRMVFRRLYVQEGVVRYGFKFAPG